MDFFEHQDRARRNSRLLFLYFGVTVVMVITSVYFALIAILALATRGSYCRAGRTPPTVKWRGSCSPSTRPRHAAPLDGAPSSLSTKRCSLHHKTTRRSRRLPSRSCAEAPIWGRLGRIGLEVQALPHATFWRHEIFPAPRSGMAICHPNSPKDDLEKMKVLDRLGLCFGRRPQIPAPN